jgi:hypothetical protein
LANLAVHRNDPDIGRGDLVRRVDIHPWLVQTRAKSKSKSKSTGNSSRINTIRVFIRNLFNLNRQKHRPKSPIASKIQKDIARVTDAVIGLRNLTEYRLRWDPHQPYHLELFEGFMCPILSHIGHKLVRLSLTVPPQILGSLAPINLPRLEHLEVGVCTLEMPRRDVDEMFDAFTVFVNNLYSTLESFSLSSRAPSHFLDLTHFFNHLGTFPHLRTFFLSMPFDGSHLTSPHSLVAYLNRHHRTLRHLHLSTSRCSPTDTPLHPSSKYWIPNILTSLVDPSLWGLRLALRPLRADLAPVTAFLMQHSHALESLVLTERQLTFDEVVMILDALADSTGQALVLKRIQFQVPHLSPVLLNLLAKKLPRLALLELLFSEVVASGQCDGMEAHLVRPFHVSTICIILRLPRQCSKRKFMLIATISVNGHWGHS